MASLSEHLGQIEPKILDNRLKEIGVNENRRHDIRQMFWRNDAYNSIISYPVYTELLIGFLKSFPDPNSTFARFEFYDFIIKNLASGEEGTKKLFIIGAALELFEKNGLQPAEFDSLLHELSITKEQINYSGLIQDGIVIEGIEPYDETKTEKVYFSHHSIQEYLATKYILSQEHPLEVLKQFVFIDKEGYKAIKPSWYNVIKFLVEIDSSAGGTMPIADWLISLGEDEDLSEIIIDESYSTAITSVNKETTPTSTKEKIFKLIYYSYQNRLLWVPIWTRDPLAELVSATQLKQIKRGIEEIERKNLDVNDTNRYVPLGLAAEIIEHVLEVRKEIIDDDLNWWYEKLVEFANDRNANGVLQRNALHALVHFKVDDPAANEALIEKVKDSFHTSDELIQQAFVDFCSKIAPNSATTINYIAKSIGDFQLKVTSRFALQRIDSTEGVKNLFEKFKSDPGFLSSFLDEESIFNNEDGNEDEGIIKLLHASSRELYLLIEDVIKLSFELEDYFKEESSYFLNGLFKIAIEANNSYIDSILRHIEDADSESKKERLMGRYVRWISELIEPDAEFIKNLRNRMVSIDEQYGQVDFERAVYRAKNNRFETGEKIYKTAENLGLLTYFSNVESEKPHNYEAERKVKTLERYRELLGDKDRFNLGVFQFYLNNIEGSEDLDLEQERERIRKLLKNTALKIDPKQFRVTLSDKTDESRSFSITSYYHMFGDALRVAQKLIPEELSVHRQQVIDLIPFAFSDDQQTILELISQVTDEELNQYVNSIMIDTTNHIRYLIPSGYIYIIEKYVERGCFLPSSFNVLKSFIGDEKISLYDQRSALESLKLHFSESDPTHKSLLEKIFQQNVGKRENEDNLKLAEVANSLLIKIYRDLNAIEWRFNELLSRATPFSKENEKGEIMSWVTPIEDELNNLYFARPLIALKDPELLGENQLFSLIDKGFDLLSREDSEKYKLYAYYLWNIVVGAVRNMNELGIKPLQKLKEYLILKSYPLHNEFNWWTYRFEELQRVYASSFSPKDIAEIPSRLKERSKNGS